jgi:hypothetical protein
MPVRQCKAFQNLDTNNLSLLDMMSRGRPFSQYQCLKNIDASPSADMSVCVGIIRMSDLSQSVIVKIQLRPSSSGKGLTKYIAIEAPLSSEMGNGSNCPFGFNIGDLLC